MFVAIRTNVVKLDGFKYCTPVSVAITFGSRSGNASAVQNSGFQAMFQSRDLAGKFTLLSARNDVFEFEQRKHKVHDQNVQRRPKDR